MGHNYIIVITAQVVETLIVARTDVNTKLGGGRDGRPGRSPLMLAAERDCHRSYVLMAVYSYGLYSNGLYSYGLYSDGRPADPRSCSPPSEIATEVM